MSPLSAWSITCRTSNAAAADRDMRSSSVRPTRQRIFTQHLDLAMSSMPPMRTKIAAVSILQTAMVSIPCRCCVEYQYLRACAPERRTVRPCALRHRIVTRQRHLPKPAGRFGQPSRIRVQMPRAEVCMGNNTASCAKRTLCLSRARARTVLIFV